MSVDDGRDKILRETGRSEGRVHLRTEFRGGRRLTPRFASQPSRALLALALECAWIDHGPAILTEPFDHVRAAVLGEGDPRGFVAIAKDSDPVVDDIKLHYELRHGPDGLGIGMGL